MKLSHNLFILIIFFLLCFFLSDISVWAQSDMADESESPAIKVAFSDDQSIIMERILYTALKRLGYEMIAKATGMRTAIADVNYGDASILPSQTDDLDKIYSNLVKVPVAIDNAEFTVYTRSNSKYQFYDWRDLAGLNLSYRWQNEYIANSIRRAGAAKLFRLDDADELWASLLSRQSDAVLLPRFSHFEHRFPSGIKRAGVVERQPVYSYVNNRYRFLVPLLEDVYKEMIADGTMSAIRSSGKSSNEKPFILHINSNNAQNEWERSQMEAIRRKLETKYSLEYYSIYLNSNEPHSQISFNSVISEMIRTEFIARYPDLVIVSGNEAFEFVMENYYLLFPNLPILFYGVSGVDDSKLYGLDEYVTGVSETISFKENTAQMLKLFPETRRIFILNGHYLSRSLSIRQTIRNSGNDLPVEIIFNEDKPLQKILDDIHSFGSDTLVLIGNYFSDSDGTFYSEEQIQKLVSQVSYNPVFCLTTSFIGDGTLGGLVSSTDKKNEIAASMALDILKGTSPKDIPVIYESDFLNQWQFDFEVLKKYKINRKNLPAGYILINRLPPLWEANPYEFKLLLMISILFLLIIIGLVLFFIRNSKITQRIKKQSELFETVNNVSSVLLEPDMKGRFEDNLQKAMDIMAEAVGADRICIWRKKKESRLCFSLNCQWEHNNFKSINENGVLAPDIYFDVHPYWNSILSYGNCINSLVRDMPPAERAELEPRNILSIFVVPIFLQDQFWGYIGFDCCKKERVFSNIETMILRSASRMIAHAIIRSEMTLQLEDTANEANNANRAKSSFLANMSHEIRTPMNAILGIAEIQLRDESLSPETQDAIEKIYESGDLLLNIINDILDLSKIEAGKMELVPFKYDIPSLINDSVQLNRLRYDSKPIELYIYVDENTPHDLFGDELRIKQVLNNILSNAFKYTDEGAVELFVSAELQKDNIEDVTLLFRIVDTGQGMTAEQINDLFNEYTRFNAEANRVTVGTGLGMSITKHLLDLMKGVITVKSELGKGTEFTVSLPQKRIGMDICGKEVADKLRKFNFRSTTLTNKAQFLREYMPYGSVLVVDDVESNIYVIKGMLLPYGIKIDTVMSGFDAIKKIEDGNVYDIVFMDHMMPKMDGIETTKKLREMGYKDKIVALTANAIIGRAEMFLQNGFDGFISKPIDSRELNAMLNDLIRNQKPQEVIEAVRYFALQHKKKAAQNAALSTGAAQWASLNNELTDAAIHDVENALAVLDEILPWSSSNYTINNNMDAGLFTTTVHGIKSALANIGEKHLSDIALKLEHAGEKGETDVILAETRGFMDALQLFLKRIKNQKAEDNAEIPENVSEEDKVFIYNKLNDIKTACADFNVREIKSLLSEIKQKIWPRKINDLIDDISLFTLRGEYTNVALAIEKAAIEP